MAIRGTQAAITAALSELAKNRGFRGAIVCTEQGLLVGSAGKLTSDEMLAGFASMFDAIVARGARDLGLTAIDEVSVLDRLHGRLVVRPLVAGVEGRLFLVVVLEQDAAWRRATTRFLQHSGPTFQRIVGAGVVEEVA
ncbi:MAG: hypothetical protein U1F43_38595 [Myxococcota bacterium]